MKPATRSDYLDRIRRVLRFVQEHLDEPLAAHVRRLRLERAAGALRRWDREVIDVALEAWYAGR